MRKLDLKKKKGIMGLDTAKSFVVGLLSLVLIGVVTMIVLVQLGDTSIVSDDNDTQQVVGNATSALSDFFSNTTVWLSLLGVVIIILIIAAVVSVVNRFGSGAAGGSL